MTSIFLNFHKIVLWASIWLILQNVPYVFEKNVYSAVVGCNVLEVPIKSTCSIQTPIE